ncbi:MAG: endonuclease/exonuclease/phosphatase family metal-dependent hydrolase [Cellvibrionaceae bacterium]|jgi:endonuclease/exonuclease/phosphatase family metal-dependent hydrolase
MHFSVLTLNLHGTIDRWLGRRELIVAGLVDSQPDVIAFQRANIWGGQVQWIVRQINERIGFKKYHGIQRRHRGFGSFADGVAIASVYPIVFSETLKLPENRTALLVNIEMPTGDTIDIVCCHLVPGIRLPEVRYQQAMELTGWLSIAGRSSWQVIAGGLNDVPESRTIQRIKQQYRSAWETVYGYEPIATWPTGLGDEYAGWTGCLDYLFATPNLEVIGARLFGNQVHLVDETLFMSDHVGLEATFSLNSKL